MEARESTTRLTAALAEASRLAAERAVKAAESERDGALVRPRGGAMRAGEAFGAGEASGESENRVAVG